MSQMKLNDELKKLDDQRIAEAQAMQDKLDKLFLDDTSNAILAIRKERDQMIQDLYDAALKGLIDDSDINQLEQDIKKKYQDMELKVYGEMKMKALQDDYAMQSNYNDLIYNADVAANKRRLAAREITTKQYLEKELNLQIEANQRMIDLNQSQLDQLNELRSKGTIDLATYEQEALRIQAVLDELQYTNEALIQTKIQAAIDMNVEVFAQMSDLMSNYVSDLASIGEGISAEWANVFDSITTGITGMSEALKYSSEDLKKELKEGGKGWAAWGQVGMAAIGAVSNMLGALAAEEDTTTKEGFEQNKKYQLGQAVLSMLSGIVGAWSSSMTLPFPGNVIAGAILSGLITAVGAVQIAKIKQTQFNSGNSSSASSSTGATANTSAITNLVAPVQYTTDIQGASTEDTVADTRVYVLESDISGTASRVNVSESENRF